MDQAQWAQTEIMLLPTEQIALRPSVQQKPLSHMPLETLAASMAREGLREPILVRAAGLRLGEGTGALALFPLLDMALSIYRDMDTFAEMEIEEYKPLV